jgi:hypothetical protein
MQYHQESFCWLCAICASENQDLSPSTRKVSQNAEKLYLFGHFLLAQDLALPPCAATHTLKTHILIFSTALTWIITLRRTKLNSEGERRNVIFQCFRHVQDGEDFGIFNTGKKNCLMLFQIARGTQSSDLFQKFLRASWSKFIFYGLVSWPNSNTVDWQTRDNPLSLCRNIWYHDCNMI